MKVYKNTVIFQLKLYLLSGKILVPAALMLITLVITYKDHISNFVLSYNITSTVCFYLLFIIGVTYSDTLDNITEQILILRLGSHQKYYFCNELVLLTISCMFSGASVLFSVITNHKIVPLCINGHPLILDVITGLFLHIILSFMGAITGSLFHKRIMKDRSVKLCCAFAVSVLVITKDLIEEYFHFFKYVRFVFPPVSEYINMLKGVNTYHMSDVLKITLMVIFYTCVICVIKEFILIKRKF